MSKPTKENYIIRIKSYIDQFDSEGNIRRGRPGPYRADDPGQLRAKRASSYYITYKETQTIGFEGCTTTIKIAEDGSRVALLRFRRGPTASCSSSGSGATSATTRPRSAP